MIATQSATRTMFGFMSLLLTHCVCDGIDRSSDPAPVLNGYVIVDDIAQLGDDVLGRKAPMLGDDRAGFQPYVAVAHSQVTHSHDFSE